MSLETRASRPGGAILVGMGFLNRIAKLATFVREAEEITQRPKMIAPPSRTTIGWTSPDRALSLGSVYRAIFIHQVSAIQLGIDVQRGNISLDKVPSIIEQPDLDTDRDEFIEYTVGCLWLHGEAFWRKIRADQTARRPNEIVELKPLNPGEVSVREDPETGRKIYHWRGVEIPARDIEHLKLMTVAGHVRGLGPIQAARLEIEGAIDARDYGAGWFSEGSMPSGVLTTDQVLSPDMADTYKKIWNDNPDGHGVRVLGQGLSYEPLLLKPADVQFLESQQFTITGIARLFGIPASIMLAAVEGQSRTYQNQVDEWRGYLRFTAMMALRKIENAFTRLLPGKQRARFNLDAFLRLDTKSRYEAHQIGLAAGFLTLDEVRREEGREPLPTTHAAPRPPKEQTSEV